MSISSDLRFHLQGVDKLDDDLRKIEIILGKHNNIRSNQLQNQLISLNLGDFACIEDYLSKIKTLRLLVEDCNIPKKDDQCI
jgi:hypothetical protein